MYFINPDEMQFDTHFLSVRYFSTFNSFDIFLISLLLACQSLPFSPDSCIVERRKKYRVRAGQTITTWKGVTLENCKDIAASIEKRNQRGSERLYWNYQAESKECLILNATGKSVADHRFVSGYKECGTRIPGRSLDT